MIHLSLYNEHQINFAYRWCRLVCYIRDLLYFLDTDLNQKLLLVSDRPAVISVSEKKAKTYNNVAYNLYQDLFCSTYFLL